MNLQRIQRKNRPGHTGHYTREIFCLLLSLIYISFVFGGCGRYLKEYNMPEESSSSSDRTLSGENSDYTPSAEDSRTSDSLPAEISLVMVGDVLLHAPVAESGLRADGSYCFDALFTNIKDTVSSADLALVNQEVIIGGSELGVSGYPCFNAPYELGDALDAAGFDVILHATNHALDKGEAGIQNCLTYWEQHPDIAVLGISDDSSSGSSGDDSSGFGAVGDDTYSIAIGSGWGQQLGRVFFYEQDGIRIAILNYTYGTNGIPMPASMPGAVNLLEEETVQADLALAEELADFTIVCPHWGTEYQLVPSAEQEYWADLFLKNGADLCIGTHPHVIEPIGWMRDDEGHEMLVYYSLGNFVNWTSSSGEGIADRMVGGMAKVTIGRTADGGVAITDYDIRPIVCHLSDGTDGVVAWFLSDYTDALAAGNAIRSQDPAFSRAYCVDLCNEVWGDSFRFE